jgi:hypothetical protein
MAAYMEEKIVFANYGHFLWKSLNLRVYMFSLNPNSDFKEFFNAVASKLNRYNGIDDTSDTNNYIQSYDSYPRWPNSPNHQNLSFLIKKYKKDTGNDFCGDIMSETYLPDSANDSKRMCIFITGTNPDNVNEERLHSAATVYFLDKFSESSNSSSASSNSMTFSQQKVLNVEAICAAPRNYVTHNGGRKLMTLLVEACKNMSVNHIYLYSINVKKTLDFYKSLGFVETGHKDKEGNLEHKLTIETNKRKRDDETQKVIELEVDTNKWTENDEQDLDAIGGVFANEQHELKVARAAADAKVGREGGSKKRKRKSKKRKSKAQNSKTRARVS